MIVPPISPSRHFIFHVSKTTNLIEALFGKGAYETSNATKVVQCSSLVVSNVSDSSAMNFSLKLHLRMNFICRKRCQKWHKIRSIASLIHPATKNVRDWRGGRWATPPWWLLYYIIFIKEKASIHVSIVEQYPGGCEERGTCITLRVFGTNFLVKHVAQESSHPALGPLIPHTHSHPLTKHSRNVPVYEWVTCTTFPSDEGHHSSLRIRGSWKTLQSLRPTDYKPWDAANWIDDGEMNEILNVTLHSSFHSQLFIKMVCFSINFTRPNFPLNKSQWKVR